MSEAPADPGTAASPDRAVLEAKGLHKSFAISKTPHEVVRGVSLTVAPGEFVAVMGPSGCGKSTLLHMLGGLEEPDQGQVILEGTDIYSLSEADRATFRRRRIGFIFQFFNLLPSLTAAENGMLPYRLERNRAWPLSRVGRDRAAKTRTRDLMAVLGLKGLQGHRPEERVTIGGKRHCSITGIEPVGAYAVRLMFDDLHSTGLFTWRYLYELGSRQAEKWALYESDLKAKGLSRDKAGQA